MNPARRATLGPTMAARRKKNQMANGCCVWKKWFFFFNGREKQKGYIKRGIVGVSTPDGRRGRIFLPIFSAIQGGLGFKTLKEGQKVAFEGRFQGRTANKLLQNITPNAWSRVGVAKKKSPS